MDFNIKSNPSDLRQAVRFVFTGASALSESESRLYVWPDFVHYCHYQDIEFGTRKVEDGAKNVFGFRSDGLVMRKARERLRGYRPVVMPGGDFRAQQLSACVAAVGQSSYAADKEVAVAFGRPGAADALADLVTAQVKAIVDIAWTCWVNRAPDAALLYDDFQARFDRQASIGCRCSQNSIVCDGDDA